MSTQTAHKCKRCGAHLVLDCGEFICTSDPRGEVLDLTLTCANECGAVLNAFVPVSEFQPIED